MTKSKNPDYWNNEKSRALRSLTMRMTRLNRCDTLEDIIWADRKVSIEDARKEIYAIDRKVFTAEDRERIFKKYKLTVADQNAAIRESTDVQG